MDTTLKPTLTDILITKLWFFLSFRIESLKKIKKSHIQISTWKDLRFIYNKEKIEFNSVDLAQKIRNFLVHMPDDQGNKTNLINSINEFLVNIKNNSSVFISYDKKIPLEMLSLFESDLNIESNNIDLFLGLLILGSLFLYKREFKKLVYSFKQTLIYNFKVSDSDELKIKNINRNYGLDEKAKINILKTLGLSDKIIEKELLTYTETDKIYGNLFLLNIKKRIIEKELLNKKLDLGPDGFNLSNWEIYNLINYFFKNDEITWEFCTHQEWSNLKTENKNNYEKILKNKIYFVSNNSNVIDLKFLLPTNNNFKNIQNKFVNSELKKIRESRDINNQNLDGIIENQIRFFVLTFTKAKLWDLILCFLNNKAPQERFSALQKKLLVLAIKKKTYAVDNFKVWQEKKKNNQEKKNNQKKKANSHETDKPDLVTRGWLEKGPLLKLIIRRFSKEYKTKIIKKYFDNGKINLHQVYNDFFYKFWIFFNENSEGDNEAFIASALSTLKEIFILNDVDQNKIEEELRSPRKSFFTYNKNNQSEKYGEYLAYVNYTGQLCHAFYDGNDEIDINGAQFIQHLEKVEDQNWIISNGELIWNANAEIKIRITNLPEKKLNMFHIINFINLFKNNIFKEDNYFGQFLNDNGIKSIEVDFNELKIDAIYILNKNGTLKPISKFNEISNIFTQLKAISVNEKSAKKVNEDFKNFRNLLFHSRIMIEPERYVTLNKQ